LGIELVAFSPKDLIKLTQKKYRSEMGLCIVEGEKLVREHGANAAAIFTRAGMGRDFDRVSSLDTPQGILAVVPIPKPTEITFPYLVLDGVQDPGNVGTILRTACAFGFKTVFSINSADPFSQKVIRSAMGAQFNLNILDVSHAEYNTIYHEKLHISPLYIADLGGQNIQKTPSNDTNFGLVLGSEGKGISVEIKALPHKIVSVPICKNVDSLNVAVAGGILMYELTK
jgi:TrmH family RNA methyltransferase